MNIKKLNWFWGSGSSWPAPQALGVLYDQSSFPNLDNYTGYGTPTTSIASNELSLSGTGTFSKGLYQSAYGYTLLCDFYRKTTFRINTIIATQRGFVVGQKDPTPASPERAIFGGLNVTTGGTRGYIYMWDQDVNLLASSGSGLTIAVNDVIQYEFERTNWTYTLTVTNLTNSPLTNNLSISYTVTPTTGSSVYQYQSQFTMSFYGGASIWTVLTDYVSSDAWKNANVCFIGDSKTEGIGVTLMSEVYPALLYSASSKKYVVEARGNSTTQDILDAIDEILALNAQTYVLSIGCNDVRAGVAQATYEANYTSIVNQLVGNGSSVILVTPAKESVLNLATLNTFINTFSGTYSIIDIYTGWNTGTMLAADGIHPNTVGQTYIQTQSASLIPV